MARPHACGIGERLAATELQLGVEGVAAQRTWTTVTQITRALGVSIAELAAAAEKTR